jgi:hypothetical protein
MELLAMKSRMDDARNLIGVMVIQREVGLSLYSKVMKGGFEEALLSSFISAISSFREEFSMDEAKWTAIPISEVITALLTDAFICAIITVDAASSRQKDQLETFGLEIGGFFDYNEEATKHVLQTPKRIGFYQDIFDPVLEKHFDIDLMKKYVGVKKTIPDRLSPVADVIHNSVIERGITPESMINAILKAGYSEYRAYSMTIEAIDGNYLIAGDTKLPPILDSPDS